MLKIFAIITVVLIILTAGCGLTIHYGGKQFENAIGGHIVLGILAVISAIITMILIIKK